MIQVAGTVVWNKRRGVALVNQNYNSWSLPKGHIDGTETALEAALRETYEETGIPTTALTVLGEVASYKRSRIKRKEHDPDEVRTVTLFLCTTDHDELRPIDPVNPEAVWVSPEEAIQLLTHPVDKEQFRRIIELPIFKRLTTT